MRFLTYLTVTISLFSLITLDNNAFAVFEGNDNLGTFFSFLIPPKRIVSLAPSVTESLYLLGEGDRVVGVTIFDDSPPEVKEKDSVGSMLNPSIEKIVSLKPDLILISREGNRPQTRNKLHQLGIKVFVVGECSSFSDISDQFLLLGKIVNREKKAEQILKETSDRIAKVTQTVSSLPAVKVFCQLGTEPIMTVSKGTFIDELLRLAGGINIAHESKIRYPRYSREAVVKAMPEVIILITFGDQQALGKQEEEWQSFNLLKARIYNLDPRLACRPLPLAFAEALERIANMLHPGISGK